MKMFLDKEQEVCDNDISKQQAASGRIVYLDLLRVISTLAVIVIHIIGKSFSNIPVTSISWQILNVYDSFVRFSVPVFVMISGVFFLDNKRPLSLKKLYSCNIVRLITAFIFWSAAYAGVSFLRNNGNSLGVQVKDFIIECIKGHYHMWFIFMIVGLYMVTPLLRAISKDKKLTEYFLLLSFGFCFLANAIGLIPKIGSMTKDIFDTMNVGLVSGYTGYYFLGYYIHNYTIKEKHKKTIYFVGILSLLATIIGTSLISVYTDEASVALYYNLLPNTLFVSMAIFICCKEGYSKIKLNEKQEKIISVLSNYSFGIYLVHDFFIIVLKNIHYADNAIKTLIAIPALSVVVFIGSLFVSFILHKIPMIKKYIV